ncbi:MAG: sigma 54-interacting transcriptional regulator [Deltaproteobacteria bacterium]|nr:sigma 54-interacting transcriptional regulator [Deltaproteobacteria bacterium]
MFEKEYSQYWKTVVETMLDGLMVVDPSGIILSVNNAFETLTGYKEKELVGQPCEILACSTCFHLRAKGGVKHCELFNKGEVRHKRCTFKRKDGSPLHILKNAAVLKDKDGVVVGGVENLADCTELVDRDRVITTLRRELSIEESFEGIIGKSAAIQQVFDLIQSAADSYAPVAIYGESGTGKELVAKAIHRLGGRYEGPFVKVNCAALNESLLESELFGHMKGAFTGADRNRKGRFEAASGGDIFLDEIGDIPLSTQVKLLRVLQEKEIERVGDHEPLSIDVRIITATNKDLKVLMEEGRFREDLYYRVGVIPIYLPPLRERPEDIPLLIDTFISRIRLKNHKNITGMDEVALEILVNYHWPGNIRELINVIEYAFVICPGGEIQQNHLSPNISGKIGVPPAKRSRKIGRASSDQRGILLKALKKTGGNKTEAAKILGISRVTLWKRLKEYDIQVNRAIQS